MKNKKLESIRSEKGKTVIVRNYGERFEGVYFDSNTLNSINRLFNQDTQIYNSDENSLFLYDLLELSNFSDLVCLTDSIYVDGHKDIGIESKGKSSREFNSVALVLNYRLMDDLKGHPVDQKFVDAFLNKIGKNAFDGVKNSNIFPKDFDPIITPLNPLSIDDLQIDSTVERWTNSFMNKNSLDWKHAVEFTYLKENKAFLKGLFYEEIFGCTYFPSLGNTSKYLINSPFQHDFLLHNLLIEAYGFIRKSEENKKKLRQLMGGFAEPITPPIMSIILNKISSPNEYFEELLTLRKEFEKIRGRTIEIRKLSNQKISFEDWLKTYKKLQQDFNSLLQEYSYTNNQFEANKSSADNMVDFTINVDNDDLVDVSVDVKKLVKFGYDKITNALRKKRIQPLPKIVNKLNEIGNQYSKAQKIWKINKDLSFFNESFGLLTNQINSSYSTLSISKKNNQLHLKVPSFRKVRKGTEAINKSMRFNYENLIEIFKIECLVRGGVNYSKTEGNKSKDYTKLDLNLDYGYHYLEYHYLSKANEHFMKALNLNKANYEAYYGLSQVELAAGNYENTLKLLKKALEYTPNNTIILNAMGIAFMEKSDFKNAKKKFKKAIEIDNAFSSAHANLGIIYSDKEEYKKAIKHLQVALEKEPHLRSCKYNLAYAYFKLNELEYSLLLLQEITKEDKLDLKAYQLYLYILIKLERIEEASVETKVLVKTGNDLFLENQFDLSLNTFKLIHDFGLLNKYILYNLGTKLDKVENFDTANKYYLLELEVNSENPRCLANYALNLIELGEEEKAFEIAKKAVNQDTNSYINLNTLLICYHKLDNQEKLLEVAKIITRLGEPESLELKQIFEQARQIVKDTPANNG